VCNLDCTYCFFLSKETLYPGSPFRMADDVLEAYISQVIRGQQEPQVSIAWQGGEPTLMGLAFFERAMSWTPCRSTAASAKCALRATANARATGSSKRPTASQG